MSTRTCGFVVVFSGLVIGAGDLFGEQDLRPKRTDQGAASATKIEPRTAIDRSPEAQKEADRYQRLHSRLSLPSEKWGATVDELIGSGDAFTLHIMQRHLKASDEDRGVAEQRKQVIAGIEKRRGRNPDQIRVDEVGLLTNRALFVRPYVCSPMQHILLKWLVRQLRTQLDDPAMRERLVKLNEELRGSDVSVEVTSDAEELQWSPTEQLRQELSKMLQVNQAR